MDVDFKYTFRFHIKAMHLPEHHRQVIAKDVHIGTISCPKHSDTFVQLLCRKCGA